MIQSLDNGGCENMLLRTLPLLNSFEHKIITLKELGELTPKFISAGIAVETAHCVNLFDIPGIRRLCRLVEEEKADIIITYLFHADMLGRFALRNITDSPIIPFLRTTYNHSKYLVARILERLTKPLVGQYLANSEAVKSFYIQNIGVRPEKITVIPNGIDSEYFDSVASDPELKQSLAIEPNDFVVTCVANLHPNKGHCYLLKAFESFFCHSREGGNPENIKSLKLLLVGDGIEKEKLQCQIQNYKSKENILFLGRRTDIPNILKASDCFILPTLFEGMSNAILEAMAASLPIVTIDIPENRVLIENEKTGLLCPAKDTPSLTQALDRLIKNPDLAWTLGNNASQKIQEEYSLRAISLRWNIFFLSISQK